MNSSYDWYHNSYPMFAGFKENETSKDAALAIEGSGRAATLRREILECLDQFPEAGRDAGKVSLTADEIASFLEEPVLSIRPRVAELNALGMIEKTGLRRVSSGGRPSHVWRRVP